MSDDMIDDEYEIVEVRADGEIVWLRPAPPRECGVCGWVLFPGDWLTRDGCCYCDRDEVLL